MPQSRRIEQTFAGAEMSWKILGKIEAQSLLDAHSALKRSLAQPENEFTRNSSIQCFEFTLELVWKTLKRVLDVYGESHWRL
jgi:hypothetical protein